MFRIISGEFRRRHLLTPADAETTRPIPDRVKESLFQVLRGHCEGSTVFDAFAGTGPIGLEALSRGASRVVLVEKDRGVFSLLERNVETLGVEDRVDLVCGDALGPGALARCPRPVHLLFMDPPYPLVRDPVGWGRVKAQFEKAIALLDDTGYAVLRTPWPLLHDVPIPGGDAVTIEAGVPRKRWKKSKKSRETLADMRWLTPEEIAEAMHPQDQADLSDEGKQDAITAEAQAIETMPPVDGPAKTEAKTVDLGMSGAVGPETHAYTGMAIHLYMRQR